jgi:guanine deaminase
VTPADQHELRRRASHPPFAIRARLLTPLGDGQTRYEDDGLLRVDGTGRISAAGPFDGPSDEVVDLRPALLLPGMVDLHAHLPQLPSAGLGSGLDLLSWLERYIFPLERDFDAAAAEVVAPAAFRALAAAGTTTAVLYGAVYEPSLEVCFSHAAEHGMRAVMGKVMMDRQRYDPSLDDSEVLDVSLRQSAALIQRWHGHDDGRLAYAVSPRFAVSCTADMLRRSVELARSTGVYWQTHLAEDRVEIEEVGRLFPEAIDYTDVYDRAGGLGPRSILAHAIHLSEREVERLAATQTGVVHCPASNLFLASGAMPLARYLAAGMRVGLGSDVAAGPELSMFSVMRAGAYTQSGLRTMVGESRASLGPLDWLRLATLEGARILGLEDRIGSLEVGKEADLICVDPSMTAPLSGQQLDDPVELMSRLIFRSRPQMVRGAWVRGRLLPAADGAAAS